MPKRRRITSSQRRAASTLSLSTVALLCGFCHGKDALAAAGGSNAPNDGVVENFRSVADTNSKSSEVGTDLIEMTIKREAVASSEVGTQISSFDGMSRGLLSSEPKRACFWRWDVSCQDDPTYRSKYGLSCQQHVKFDCLSFLGPFAESEVEELVERCPCSCRVECNTFSWEPSSSPSARPSISFAPTPAPTSDPTPSPSARPSAMPTLYPTHLPTRTPTAGPTNQPTLYPTNLPTEVPTAGPTKQPSSPPSSAPSKTASSSPSGGPSPSPSSQPSSDPSVFPTDSPSVSPTYDPYECDDPECQDDPTYSSHLGLNCLAHARFDCTGMHAIGYSTENVFVLINSCPCSCNIRCNIWTREPSGLPSTVPTVTFSPSESLSDHPSHLPSSTPTLSLMPSSAPTSKPTYGTYECNNPSCQDNLLYKSPLLLACSDHGRFDCKNMHAIGYNANDIYELITNCPCSCSIMCGSFPAPPTDAPSMAPTISTRYVPLGIVDYLENLSINPLTIISFVCELLKPFCVAFVEPHCQPNKNGEYASFGHEVVCAIRTAQCYTVLWPFHL